MSCLHLQSQPIKNAFPGKYFVQFQLNTLLKTLLRGSDVDYNLSINSLTSHADCSLPNVTKMNKHAQFVHAALRGPAPKKRPMTSGSKIESTDFYFPSRGYQILFKS